MVVHKKEKEKEKRREKRREKKKGKKKKKKKELRMLIYATKTSNPQAACKASRLPSDLLEQALILNAECLGKGVVQGFHRMMPSLGYSS